MPISRFQTLPLTLAGTALALLCVGCGGGGTGSGNAPVISNTPTLTTPPVDPTYYNVPSTTLGAVVNSASVTFSYWNPSAKSVSVALYKNWNDSLSAPASSVAMAQDGNGVWTSAQAALGTASYYAYNVGGSYVLDPYARAMAQWQNTPTASIAGDKVGKGAILDPASILPDGDWVAYKGSSAYFDGSAMKAPGGGSAPYAYASSRDAIIYEAGIRDLTVDPNLQAFKAGHPWGTYKGLIDLLPHIQKLGVTHVQLLCPLANYTYDETRNRSRELDNKVTAGANYNWGYDPHNYFTPSGMYSATPNDPAARIQELRTLVNEIHKAGMGVILDVVYNHTANDAVLGDASYYRTTSNNGAGSHDVKSENVMVRKLIVDSIRQWVKDYRVDGFRFDLMGVLDYQTINAAYAAAHDLNPNTLFLGEGWKNYYSGPSTDYNQNSDGGADQNNAAQFKGKNIAMFSDSYRQIFKNGYPADGQPAFLSNQAQPLKDLFANVQGAPTNFSPGSTNGVVNYLTCHDNLCLYDALAMATNAATGQDGPILQRAKIGYAILLTSQGTAFIHAGDEMFRSKETPALGARNTKSNGGRAFVDNSYNASDAINLVDWSKVYSSDPIAGGFTNYATGKPGYQLYAYVQGLIALRKATNAFRLPDSAVAANVTLLAPQGSPANTLAFGYQAVSSNGTGTYYVFHNADPVNAQAIPVPTSLTGAALLVDGNSAGLAAITGSSTATLSPDGKTVTLAPLSSAVFKN